MERFRRILVQHLRNIKQSGDSQKDTMYLVRLDDIECVIDNDEVFLLNSKK